MFFEGIGAGSYLLSLPISIPAAPHKPEKRSTSIGPSPTEKAFAKKSSRHTSMVSTAIGRSIVDLFAATRSNHTQKTRSQ